MKCKVTLKPVGIECDADIFFELDAKLLKTEIYVGIMIKAEEYTDICKTGNIETVWHNNKKLFEIDHVKGTFENMIIYSTPLDESCAIQKLTEIYDFEVQSINRQEKPNAIGLHKQICEQMTLTYIRKNNDYGNAFANLRNEIPNSILVRLYDKYSRLKTLMNGEKQMVNDESIDDTLLDLANYCILELIESKLERGETDAK